MEWISVKTSLPEHGDRVIVYGCPLCGTCDPSPTVLEARYGGRKGGDVFNFGEYDCDIDVTHWMPLPIPPEE